MSREELERLVVTLEEEMFAAAEELRFEYAAKLRDEIKELRRELDALERRRRSTASSRKGRPLRTSRRDPGHGSGASSPARWRRVPQPVPTSSRPG